MLVERFVGWSRTASVGDRVEAVRKLCEAYRFATVPEHERRTTVAVLTAALDDPSPKVRRQLAEGLAPCELAPRHVLLALLRDVPAVARPALAAVALTDTDLEAFVAGNEACALAVAQRETLSAPLARAVVCDGGRDAVLALLNNAGVVLSTTVLGFVAERFETDAAVRTALLRHDLPADLRLRLRRAVADDLAAYARDRNWLTPARAGRLSERDHAEAALEHAAAAGPAETCELVRDLATESRLTAALLLRAAAAGQLVFLEEACAFLTRTPRSRVAAAFRSRRRANLKALLLKGGIGADLGAMLALAHRRWCEAAPHREADRQTGDVRVLRAVVRELSALPNLDAQTVCLLAEIEIAVERGAAHAHADQSLLAA